MGIILFSTFRECGMNTVYITNPMLKPMLSSLNKEWSIIGCWDNRVDKTKVTALATTVWEQIDAKYLMQFPNLKIICHLGLGTDNIDNDYLLQNEIILRSQPNSGIHDTAELALTLMLSLARKIIPNHLYTRTNQWLEGKPRYQGNHLLGKQLGLVGLGQIGSKIAEFAKVLGMKIAYTARQDKNNEYIYYNNALDLAYSSDFLIVCCTGGIATQSLIDARVLTNLGANGYLINVSRGSVIDQNALIQALKKGVIAGAGLDVYTEEPEVPLALRQLENVVLSPHMGSSTHENLDMMYQLQAQQLNQYLVEFIRS